MENQNALGVKFTFSGVVNYVMQQNRVPIVQEIEIHNTTGEPLKNIVVHIETNPNIINEYTQSIDMIEADGIFTLSRPKLEVNVAELANLTERVCGMIKLEIKDTLGHILYSQHEEITFLAFDEWPGALYYPEILTAFVTPNHPQISQLVANSAKLLMAWGESPSLNAYQTHNPNRVLLQAAAIYGTLQKENIFYAMPPASFEVIGQRIRQCDTVISQKLGTCMDLTLLYTACLEAIGLHPLLILQNGHIFAGVWLDELTFPEAIQDDISLITKRIADGVNEIAVIESTAFVAGKNISFDQAQSLAQQNLKNTDTFLCIIDIARARMSGVRPIPQRIKGENGYIVETQERAKEEITQAPKDVSVIHVGESVSSEPTGKLAIWERKLLDLSLRNSLINLRMTRSIIPILTYSIDELEDKLAMGVEFGIRHLPPEIDIPQTPNFDVLTQLDDYQALLQSEFINSRLRSSLNEQELSHAIVNLYRSSRTAQEENGANTLYLAIGLMQWYESALSEKPRYAPVILLPVDIIRKSANKGYVIRLRDEEPQINITLLEKLKQEYGITISGLENLVQDAHGLDTKGIFTTLRRGIMDQPRWDIIETCVLGTFTFSQFVMWNDLENRIDDLMRNDIVRSFIEGKLTWVPQSTQMGDVVDENDVLLPVSTDATQLHAIKLALSGESFVLHGPPGTGKSQTITAIIANALAQKKSVLFVAEKMAALSVVQKRLEKIGLGPFCLEVHSNKAKKSDILEHLRKTSELKKAMPAQNYEAKANQLAKQRQELDTYVLALHEKQAYGMSIYEAINIYELNSTAPDVIQFSSNVVARCRGDFLVRQDAQVNQLIASAKNIGHPKDHMFSRIGTPEYSYTLKNDLPTLVNDYQNALADLAEKATALSQSLSLNAAKTMNDYQYLSSIAELLKVWYPAPSTWASFEQYDKTIGNMPHQKNFASIKAMASHFIKANEIKHNLLNGWDQSYLSQAGRSLLNQWKQAETMWFLPKFFAQNKIIKALSPYAKTKVDKATLLSNLTALADYQDEMAKATELYQHYQVDLGDYNRGEQTDWQAVLSLADVVQASAKSLDELCENMRQHAANKSIYPLIDAYVSTYEKMAELRRQLYMSLAISNDDVDFSDEIILCESIKNNLDKLKDWTVWNYACQQAKALELTPFITAYQAGLSHDEAYSAYQKALYRTLIHDAVEKSNVLSRFSGVLFDDKIELFKRMDVEITVLSKQEIYCRLLNNVPDFTAEASSLSEVGILQRAIRSKGRGISIRSLFEKTSILLPRLCPCMLMSPISAAQYLDPKTTPFDLVIFDEASQMPTSRAIGAIARGKSAVIVGDPKQMPPTSFFSINKTDEDNFDTEDLESILDDCLALNMPQSHLLWHYRSRHESLIAFSNHQFYEKKLYTFPSVNDRETKVKLVSVAGTFDRGKTRQNRQEAEAIVAEVIRRFHDKTARQKSVGIITFNIQQQNLIDDLLSEACEKDVELDTWVYQSEEPLFIKNLENVQGDERDVILFSIGFAPDKNGNFYMNFGPLNREGGWRRLNVAFTRARDEMQIFSSITADQIDLSRTSSEGVAALKAFLNYARTGRYAESEAVQNVEQTNQNGIANVICRYLKTHGYDTVQSIGKSGFKVDIGVVDLENPDTYLLGILLDGQSYQTAKTTRDREIAQISVLMSLGWNTHRVWSMDWWENKDKVLERILEVLAELKSQQAQPTPITEDKPASESIELNLIPTFTSEITEKTEKQLETYCIATLNNPPLSADEFVQSSQTGVIIDTIKAVLLTEAPICEELLIRRVVQSFGITRAGSRIQSHMQTLFDVLNLPFTMHKAQKIYWSNEYDDKDYSDIRANGDELNKRAINEIPVIEISNGVCRVLKEQVALPEESLIRETANLFGFTRVGANVTPSILEGISYALEKGYIQESKSKYYTINAE